MPVAATLLVKDLKLDLTNFRTVPQPSEQQAVQAMIAINPSYFWGLAKSLFEDGYLPTENILVLSTARIPVRQVVKEGNRRIAVLKMALGFIRRSKLNIPEDIEAMIQALPAQWKSANSRVPCTVYTASESATVDRIIDITHGKGNRAGRDHWTAVARARHNRDKNGESEPALDLLESYLKQGKNLTEHQKEAWPGDYPLSVLAEALKKVSTKLGLASVREVVETYPGTSKDRNKFENLLEAIGLKQLGFPDLRANDDVLAIRYGFPKDPVSKLSTTSGTAATASTSLGTSTSSGSSTASAPSHPKTVAYATTDPKSVMHQLRHFKPVGNGRDKVVTLVNEAKNLRLQKNPLAFCFLLRSMFEISAKAYCDDHSASGGPSATKASGEDRTLKEVLRDIELHLTKNQTDKSMVKKLHGAIADLAKSEGLLSVTSMNHLVHHPKFTVTEADVSSLFSNIFPLLDAMNR